MKYRKKPVVIDAIQWTGLNPDEIKEFVGKNCNIEYYDAAYEAGVMGIIATLTIHTLEGDMRADKGDYIIKGVKGEFYPCKPDVFEQTYEKAESVAVAFGESLTDRGMTTEELTEAFKYIVMKCDMIINNEKYKADDWTQANVEDIAELCNHILDGDYGKIGEE